MRPYDRTRSNRVYALGALLSIALFVTALAGAAGARAASAREEQRTVRVVVRRGDTLWSVAQRYDIPGSSISTKIDAIRAASGLASSALRPGQTLVIPVRTEHGLVAQQAPQPSKP